MYDTVHRALINRYTHTYVFSHTQRPGDWCNNSVVHYTDFTYSIIILQRHCWWTSHYIQPENLPPLFSQKPRPFRTTLDLLSPTKSTCYTHQTRSETGKGCSAWTISRPVCILWQEVDHNCVTESWIQKSMKPQRSRGYDIFVELFYFLARRPVTNPWQLFKLPKVAAALE